MPAIDSSYGPFYTFFSTLAAPSSELFLCISGAILLPVTKSFPEFYKVRFTKLLYPILFWSVVTTFYFFWYGEYGIKEAILKLLLLPFKPVHGVYWFIYAIVGLYLIAPFVSKWLIDSSKKQLQLFLMLWGITLVLPLFNYFIPGFYDLDGSYYNMFCYFGGFLGYMILGVYLRKYPIEIGGGIGWTLLTNMLITILLLLVIFILKRKDVETSIVVDNLSLFSAIAVANIFTFVQQLSKMEIIQKTAPFFENFAKYSFGVYLSHIVVIRSVWLLFSEFRLHPIIETPMICILSLIFAYIIVRLLSRLPFSKYIIGV